MLHIPLVMGGVVPAYNLSEVKQPLKFTAQVLADIYTGKITKWNDPGLQKLNEGVALPDRKILVIYRSEPSGTTYTWVEFLSKASQDWKLGVKTSVEWPVGEGAKGSEGVAGKLAKAEGTIGYVELLYALQKGIQYGAVQNREGQFVQANLETVTDGGQQLAVRHQGRPTLFFDRRDRQRVLSYLCDNLGSHLRRPTQRHGT